MARSVGPLRYVDSQGLDSVCSVRVLNDPMVPVSQRCAGQVSGTFLSAIDGASSVDGGVRRALTFGGRFCGPKFLPTTLLPERAGRKSKLKFMRL